MNNKHGSRPPLLASWLVQSVLPGDSGTAIVGDLIEEYYQRIEIMSPGAASLWFWSQACRSIPWTLRLLMIKPDRLRNAGVALSVFVVMAMFKVAAEQLLSRFAALANPTRIVLAPIIFLATTSIAGCIARRIRAAAAVFLAAFVLLAVVVLISIRICTTPVPWWYQLIFLTLGPLSVVFLPSLVWARNPRP